MKEMCDENYSEASAKCCDSCKQATELANACENKMIPGSPFTPMELRSVGQSFTECDGMTEEYPELCRKYGHRDYTVCCRACKEIGN